MRVQWLCLFMMMVFSIKKEEHIVPLKGDYGRFKNFMAP